MKENNTPKDRIGGLPVNALVAPIAAALLVLHVLIVAVIIMVNTTSSNMSVIMQSSSAYIMDATSLQAGSSLLNETANTFVLMPTNEAGAVNVHPMLAYASELGNDRRAADVLERFEHYDGVPEAAMENLRVAAENAAKMVEMQRHALTLVRTVYPLPDEMPFTAIPLEELSEASLALTEQQRVAAARATLLSSGYSACKQAVSSGVSACIGAIQAASADKSAETGSRIRTLRRLLWIVTFAIMALLAATFITLYSQLITPLRRFVQLIGQDHQLDAGKGLREVRQVASSYNALLKRRDQLDAILRSAAETDALTNLPNRYRFEQYLLESGESGYSMAMVLFDINYLKTTNDTLGHLAGDKLIREAADCISACFGETAGGCCFRFGGDEFAAVVKNCTPESIRERVRRFRELEKAKGISVSLGYAYTPDIGRTTFKQLLDDADKTMYVQKKKAHGEAR